MSPSNIAIVFGPNLLWGQQQAASLAGQCSCVPSSCSLSTLFEFVFWCVTHCAAMGRINSFTQFLVANTLELFPSGAVDPPAASAVAAADPPSAPVEAAAAAEE